MSAEKFGTLIGKVAGSQLVWSLVWVFNGKPQTFSKDKFFGVLPASLRNLESQAFPQGVRINVAFVLERNQFLSMRIADDAFEQELEQAKANADRAEEIRLAAVRAEEARKIAKYGTFRQPGDHSGGNQPSQFRNPYNFIPAPEGVLGAEHPLRHAAPRGHHIWHEDTFSGTLTVSLTVATPLIVSDTARGRRAQNKHLTVDPLTDASGNPVIPITSFKGALRSAYEAVTLSRMGVLDGHGEKLGRRAGATESNVLVPARVAADKTIELLSGSHPAPKLNGPPPGNLMYAAWLRLYKAGNGLDAIGPNYDTQRRVLYRGGGIPRHKDEVVCWLRRAQKLRDGQPKFDYWRVVEIAKGASLSALSSEAQIRALRSPDHGNNHRDHASVELKQVKGFVCITNQNIGGKHDERVFFKSGSDQDTVSLDGDEWTRIRSEWKTLIEDYAKQNRRAVDKRKAANIPLESYRGRDIGNTAFSRHVINADHEKELQPGDLIYARLNRDGKITALYPVMIARELSDYAPGALVPDTLRPAKSISELSPADRVFGWVSQDGTAKDNRNMVRGQLRIATLDYVETGNHKPIATFPNPGLALAILSTAKPQQARFYLAGDRNGTAQPVAKRADETFYKGDPSTKGLRGRKVYPHHRHTTVASIRSHYWDGPLAIENPAAPIKHESHTYHREYVRQNSTRDDQNRSITGWVTPETQFTARIEVINLSAAELGALIWLLTLPSDHYLRMGFGKALGFGSLHMSLTSCDLADGTAIRADYASLLDDGTVGTRIKDDFAALDAGPVAAYKQALVDAFDKANKVASFEDIKVIQAFKAAATGFPDMLPLHYPRAASEPGDGKNYEWFVANVAPANRKENKPEGPRYSLPPLWGEKGLPFLK